MKPDTLTSTFVMCRDIVHTMSRHFLCSGALMCRVIVPLFGCDQGGRKSDSSSLKRVFRSQPRINEGVGPFAFAEPVLDVMCFEPEPDTTSQCCRGAVAGIHLRGDAMEPVVVKPEGEYCSDGFAGEPFPTIRRVEDPPDLALPVLTIGEPQRDTPDRDAVMLDDQRKRPTLTIDISLR